MSNPPPPGPPSQATRQLLEELDALMKRMLALPVNQVEEELRARSAGVPAAPLREPPPPSGGGDLNPAPAPAASGPEAAPPGEEIDAATGPALRLAPAPGSGDDDAGPPAGPADTPLPFPEPSDPAADGWEDDLPASPEILAALGRPVPFRSRERRMEREAPGAAGNPGALPSSLIPHPSSLSPWLRPLLWANEAFDRCTARMGRPGRWLRGAPGRDLLGWVGLGMLAGVLGWVLGNEIGWTR